MSSIVCTGCGQEKKNYKMAYFSKELSDVIKTGEFVCEEYLNKRIAKLRKEKFKLVTSSG